VRPRTECQIGNLRRVQFDSGPRTREIRERAWLQPCRQPVVSIQAPQGRTLFPCRSKIPLTRRTRPECRVAGWIVGHALPRLEERETWGTRAGPDFHQEKKSGPADRSVRPTWWEPRSRRARDLGHPAEHRRSSPPTNPRERAARGRCCRRSTTPAAARLVLWEFRPAPAAPRTRFAHRAG
jgi:hypothetical protein